MGLTLIEAANDQSHHEGAIAMADLVLQRPLRPEIRALAERIGTSQSRETCPDAPPVPAAVRHGAPL